MVIVLKLKQMFEASRVQVISRQKLKCIRENIEVNRVKYNIFSIRIEFLTTNNLDPDCESWHKFNKELIMAFINSGIPLIKLKNVAICK